MLEPTLSPVMNAHLWRTRRAISGRLRCAVALGGDGIEAWARKVLDLVQLDPAVAIECVCLIDAWEHRSWSNVIDWIYGLRRSRASPFLRMELTPRAGTALLDARGDLKKLRAQIAEMSLDVVIWLESRPLDLDTDGLAPWGVWSFRWNAPEEPRTYPPYWREAAAGLRVITLTLEQRDHGKARPLAVCHLPNAGGWSSIRNAADPVELAGPVLLRTLLDGLEAGAPRSRAVGGPGPEMNTRQEARATMSAIVRHSFGRAWRTRSRRTDQPKWFTAIAPRNRSRSVDDRFETSGFQEITAFRGSQFADPALIVQDGRHWLFVEEIPDGASKGRLAVMELDRNGIPGEPTTILDRPYHLSYPMVFRHEQDYFMLPESGANNTVELYRATRFPFEWKLERTLQSGVRVVDTTPLWRDGIWYFMTTAARPSYETFLFWSETLDGDWHYHPANPISSDVRLARGAGAFFWRGETLIRPAQDCSIRYGYALVLQRVTTLTPSEYREEVVEVIRPEWRPGLLGMHSISSDDSFEAIDWLRYAG